MNNKIAIAGRQLLKGNFGNAVSAIITKSATSQLIQPSTYRNGNFFFGVNGADKAFVWGNYNSSLRAYQDCPVVASIINKKAQNFVNGQVFIMDDKGKVSNSKSAKAIRKLFNKPNYLQSGREFKAQGKVYQQIYGYTPILVIKPVGYESDYSAWKLWNLPPWMIQVEDSTELFYETGVKPFKRIWINYMGRSTQLNPDNIFFLKENQISTSTFSYASTAENVSLFLPDSKLCAIKDPIDNFISSLNSRGSMTRDRGPQWLLTNDQADTGDAGLFPVDPKAIEALHTDFLQYGIMRGQRKAIITDAKLKLQTVGFNVAELKLLEGELQDAKMIADQLNYPPYLLGLVDAKFDNQQIAERNLYTNSIMPDSLSDDEQWSNLFGLEDMDLKIVTDFSHLPALQEDIAEKGKGRYVQNQGLLIEFLNNQITANRWREINNEDTVEGQDKYYHELLKEGIVFGAVPNVSMPADSKTTVNNN